MTKMTAKQINNSYSRAAKVANALVVSDQMDFFAATSEQMSSERGAAMCAAGFAAQALANLANGDYEKFLTDLRLAGGFAQNATDAHYNRTRI